MMNFRDELNKRREAVIRCSEIQKKGESFLEKFLMALAVEPNFLNIKSLTFDTLKEGFLTALDAASVYCITSVKYEEDDAKEILAYIAKKLEREGFVVEFHDGDRAFTIKI